MVDSVVSWSTVRPLRILRRIGAGHRARVQPVHEAERDACNDAARDDGELRRAPHGCLFVCCPQINLRLENYLYSRHICEDIHSSKRVMVVLPRHLRRVWLL